MRISEYDELGPGSGMLIEHDLEEPIKMGIGQYGSSVGKNINRIFQDLNAFWAWRPKEEQQAIFNIYKNLNEDITSAFNESDMFSAYRDAIVALSEYHKPDLLEHWLRRDGRMYLPDNLNDVVDVNYPKEQTYTTSQYWGLLGYATSFKALMPIFSEAMTGRKTDDIFTYLIGHQLITGTMYLDCEQYERLREFVEFILAKEQVTASAGAILCGLSSAEIPRWIMSSVLIDRLVTTVLPRLSDVEGEYKTQSLIANLYRHVQKQVTKLNMGTSFATKEKIYESNRPNEEDNTSFAENYPKVKTAGHVALGLMNQAGRDIVELARRVKPDVNVDHLLSLLAINEARTRWAPLKFQLKIAGLVMRKEISPYAYGNLKRDTTLHAMTAAMVIMHELGFSTISDVISMVPAPVLKNVAPRSGVGEKIKDDQLNVLRELLPLQRVLRSTESGVTDVRREGRQRHGIKNPAVHAIDSIMSQINDRRWIVYSDSAIREASEMIAVSNSNESVIPFSMRNILADFYIELNSKRH